MNTIKKIVLGIFLSCIGVFYGQETATKNIDGTYQMLFADRQSKTKVMQYAEANGTKMLLVAACSKCMPAIYEYEAEESTRIGKPVFFNPIGLYVITYDSESFVIMKLSTKEGENFSYLNFYSKNASKLIGMTKAKMETYILRH